MAKDNIPARRSDSDRESERAPSPPPVLHPVPAQAASPEDTTPDREMPVLQDEGTNAINPLPVTLGHDDSEAPRGSGIVSRHHPPPQQQNVSQRSGPSSSREGSDAPNNSTDSSSGTARITLQQLQQAPEREPAMEQQSTAAAAPAGGGRRRSDVDDEERSELDEADEESLVESAEEVDEAEEESPVESADEESPYTAPREEQTLCIDNSLSVSTSSEHCGDDGLPSTITQPTDDACKEDRTLSTPSRPNRTTPSSPTTSPIIDRSSTTASGHSSPLASRIKEELKPEVQEKRQRLGEQD